MNLVAAVTGAGGLPLIAECFGEATAPGGPGAADWLVATPDVFATFAFVLIVLVCTPLIGALRRVGNVAAGLALGLTTLVALAVVVATVAADTNWLTVPFLMRFIEEAAIFLLRGG